MRASRMTSSRCFRSTTCAGGSRPPRSTGTRPTAPGCPRIGWPWSPPTPGTPTAPTRPAWPPAGSPAPQITTRASSPHRTSPDTTSSPWYADCLEVLRRTGGVVVPLQPFPGSCVERLVADLDPQGVQGRCTTVIDRTVEETERPGVRDGQSPERIVGGDLHDCLEARLGRVATGFLAPQPLGV